MTVLHLVRHAEHTLQDRVLVGRTPGVALSTRGRLQADELGARFAAARRDGTKFDAVVSSPRRRARETAAAIATAGSAPLEIAAGLDELDFGSWTGQAPASLDSDATWFRWNAQRATSRCPGGESMDDVWARVLAELQGLRRRAPDGTFVLVTHAEPIRAAVLRATGRSFDDFMAVACEPASVTTLLMQDDGLQLADASMAADAKAAA